MNQLNLRVLLNKEQTKKFLNIKEDLGLVNNSDTVRAIINIVTKQLPQKKALEVPAK